MTLTATVTPMVTASGIPTGTVTFYDFETNPIATVGVSDGCRHGYRQRSMSPA